VNERIEELARSIDPEAWRQCSADDVEWCEKFAELIINECCFKLLMMDAKAQGTHNYYKHAALELKRNFTEKL
jgi:hypothetical protein